VNDERKIKMNPFAKTVVKTQDEKDELLRQARAEWDKLGAHQHLIAESDEIYLRGVADMIEIEQPTCAPQPTTAMEKREIENKLRTAVHLDRMYGGRMYDDGTAVSVLDKAWKEKQDRELAEFLAPARRAESALDKVIEAAIEKAVHRMVEKASGSSVDRATIPTKPIPERESLVPLLKAGIEENASSDAARFLSAFVRGDDATMRSICRSLAAA
jgi:hypothetical protein